MRWCSKRTEMVFLTCLKFASPAWGKLWFLAKEATESLRCADSPSEERKGMYELPTRPLQFGLGFWPRLRGRVFLRRANERTLSNTDEAEIAVPAPPAVCGITIDRESRRYNHSHSLLPREVSDLASRLQSGSHRTHEAISRSGRRW